MYYIKDAKYLRTEEYGGHTCAVIQVSPGTVDDPDLFVYVARSKHSEGYEIVKMIRSDAELEIDWYDNSQHQAYAVVAEENFGDEGWPEPARQREEFKLNLLAHREIAARLQRELEG